VSDKGASSLTAASTLSSDDLLYLLQSGNSRKLTIGDLTTHLGSALSLGTAAVEDIGTSGANVPLLSTANTWSGKQTFQTGNQHDYIGVTDRGWQFATDVSTTQITAANQAFDTYADAVIDAASLSLRRSGTERVNLGASLVVNEAGADYDVRMEGDTLAHLFFLDASTDRIGINDSAPTSLVTVKANSITGPHIDVWCDDGVRQPDIAATGYGVAGGGIFHSKRARGDKTTPTQLLSGDEIGGYGGRPYTSGGSFTPSSPASIHFLVAEDQTATANAALIRFLTTPIGSTYADRKTRLQITHDGVVWAIDEGTHSFLVTRQTKPWSDARFLASGEGASGQFGASVGAVMYGGASNLTAGFRGGTARGTAATPTATQADDFLVFLGGHGYETTTPGFSSGSRGLFGIKATENFTSTAQGTYATIETTPASSTTRAERVRVTAAGQHVVGHTAALATTLATASVTPRSQTVGTDNATSSFLGARFSADSGGPVYYLGKSRHATAGSHTVVQDGDNLGSISWAGSDGTDFAEGARVTAQVDGTPGSGDMPTRMLFYTSADGSESPTERMRITSAGLVSLTGSFGRSAPVTKTADFTLDATENYVINNRAATNTATLPAASSWTGREVFMKTIQAQAVVSASSNVVPSTSATAGTAILPATDGAWALLVSDGTNWVIVAANPLV
jgi:hypothetical protein